MSSKCLNSASKSLGQISNIKQAIWNKQLFQYFCCFRKRGRRILVWLLACQVILPEHQMMRNNFLWGTHQSSKGWKKLQSLEIKNSICQELYCKDFLPVLLRGIHYFHVIHFKKKKRWEERQQSMLKCSLRYRHKSKKLSLTSPIWSFNGKSKICVTLFQEPMQILIIEIMLCLYFWSGIYTKYSDILNLVCLFVSFCYFLLQSC